ncbi:iron chelate uptake ABC transporter family permease subunit [Solirubrobacter sp. CPCC 204708]|uniref:Iron chelate uptake ABC transporter family permease subunit n=1 Tax=Solirubrobacter deserti TaxID=2282478 RepID=A0ABT4RVY9_9ACTN|nr:iron chelate uptake ABC transporter family permease subunit [Solirubrobacter deserti]MBE2318901.1 iron chelate uptake ABC transporter family permease subunit [Solirubrobacter deserti]MDA0142405.1 iron chelate uptake ABC transporter family permease subunit [Solirubrobacter deserti]
MSAGVLSVRVLRVGESVSLRVRRRPVVVGFVLVAVALGLSVYSLGTGEFSIPPGTVVSALLGGSDPASAFIVRDLRLPRVLCAIFVGVALGLSGAVFQSLTRNPLGSPDIVGFPQGASVGALIVITMLSGSGLAVSLGAMCGGALTALAVYLLSFKRGGTSGYRLILIGIAISFLLVSVTDFLLARARIEDAQEATRWLLGSLNGRNWDDVRPLAISLLVFLPLAIPAGRALRALELGDDAAHALGLRVERSRLALIALAVGLVSVTTVAVGPIGFIALTAPQIARRITGTAGLPLVCSALMGAVLVLAADLAAQRLVPDRALPVGVMSGLFGGLYLAWLLSTEWRKGRRG